MTPQNTRLISDSLSSLGRESGELVPVVLSHELIGLLSEQMYGSPLKAIEEMVVNAYDAEAGECRIRVPSPETQARFIAVYDNGEGMDREEIKDLWNIGRSRKRDEQIQILRSRKQIGKFGIGKLATYAVATKITYFSKKDGVILAITTDFARFDSSPTGQTSQVLLPVYEVDRPAKTLSDARVQPVLEALGLNEADLTTGSSWTLVILEDLKPSVNIHMGRLKWVLQTAMPLRVDFQVQLNGATIESAKENLPKAVEFEASELPERRLSALRTETNQNWQIEDEKLVSNDFPSGITGTIMVTEGILRTGKSDDIMRSHGFFVKVRGRLVNEKDARFGLHELSHEIFNRFRADIEIDDLDNTITAPREGVGESPLREAAERVLNALFNEARSRYDNRPRPSTTRRKKEHEMSYVAHKLFEFPTADALSIWEPSEGAEADNTWFYIKDIPTGESLNQTIQELYSGVRNNRYSYDYMSEGPTERIVKFLPGTSQFILNDDHEVVRAHKAIASGQARDLLEEMVTAEAMLEVYLREAEIPPKVVGDILEKRDKLLRSLANDHLTSVASIGESLIVASNQDHELEIALVAAARAIGFVAAHIGGSGTPDGIATLSEHPGIETRITLEAKSSNDIPSINDIGMGTLDEHVAMYEADGCLLVAPDYPGETLADQSSISRMAIRNRISCWTVKQLADVVSATQSRHISARRVLKIILNKFAPSDVAAEVQHLLSTPRWTEESLYDGVLAVLEHLSNNIPDARPTTDMVLGQLATLPDYPRVTKNAIEQALQAIASSSKGAMTLRGEEIKVHTSIAELRRRTAEITGNQGTPRRNGDFSGHAAQ